ncbi:MAG: MFS transporter, partial [Ferrimicrobium sp.]
GIIVFILGNLLLRESFDPSATKKIDWAGMIALSIGMFTLTLALIQSNEKGWLSVYILSMFVIATFSVAAFVVIERKSKNPMLPMQMMRIKPFMAGTVTLFVLGIGIMGGLFLLSLFFIDIMGMSELSGGLMISVMALAAMLFAPFCGSLSDKIGSRLFGAPPSEIPALNR